jgi:hypothetical protein
MRWRERDRLQRRNELLEDQLETASFAKAYRQATCGTIRRRRRARSDEDVRPTRWGHGVSSTTMHSEVQEGA